MLTAPFGAPRPNRLLSQRRLAAILVTLSATAVACGGGAAAEPQVASLDSSPTAATATDSSVDPADTQDALLAYAACMRENGIDMADPTFDADGNAQGGLGFGPDSGIDPRSDDFQTAQTACGSLLEGVTLGGPGGGQGGGLDRDAIQAASADFTACLRDEGLDVDDLTLGGPGGGAGNGPPAGGSLPTDGSLPPGGFQGGPPPDGADGQGFDPTSRLVEQLGLDDTDPAVAAALTKCQPILEAAFQPADSTTATTP